MDKTACSHSPSTEICSVGTMQALVGDYQRTMADNKAEHKIRISAQYLLHKSGSVLPQELTSRYTHEKQLHRHDETAQCLQCGSNAIQQFVDSVDITPHVDANAVDLLPTLKHTFTETLHNLLTVRLNEYIFSLNADNTLYYH
eukprot:TRINITY_DN55645_c0_g1_i1.p1 TRINITY_DN55645_c0_g1~~TRINITY_DN55645_c0_g1_i1.p1  ORF type:complete len:143 (-),score=4.09 TRINITY_DN55645_c0_g1_i1:377-805(-)